MTDNGQSSTHANDSRVTTLHCSFASQKFVYSSFLVQTRFQRKISYLLRIFDIADFFEVQKVKYFRRNIFADQLESTQLQIVYEMVHIIEARLDFGNF